MAATAVLLGASVSGPALAADCQIQDALPLKLYATQPSDLFVEQAAPVASASYKLGEPITAKPGDVLLKRKITMVGQFASFEQDVVYKSGLPFSTRYALKAGERYPLLKIPRAPQLYAIALAASEDNDDWVFINESGELCEKPMVFERWHELLTYRAGSYKPTPALAAMISSAEPATVSDAVDGDTLIVERIDAAAVDLTLRRASGGKMGEAQKASFSVDSKQIEFGGYKLRVDAVSPAALTVAVIGEPALD